MASRPLDTGCAPSTAAEHMQAGRALHATLDSDAGPLLSAAEWQEVQRGAAQLPCGADAAVTLEVTSPHFSPHDRAHTPGGGRVPAPTKAACGLAVESPVHSVDAQCGRADPSPRSDTCGDALTCVVCFEAPAAVGFLHSDSVHRAVCAGCAVRFGTGDGCPLCRKPIERKLAVF